MMEHGTDWMGNSWDELKTIRQAVAFLVMRNKPKKTLEDIKVLYPILSIPQLYRISTLYSDDKYNMGEVSFEVSTCQGGLELCQKTEVAETLHQRFVIMSCQVGKPKLLYPWLFGHCTHGWLVAVYEVAAEVVGQYLLICPP